MATAESVVCRRCGYSDSGKYCSECGARLAAGNAWIEVGRTFTRPLWDYIALFRDIARTRDLVAKVKAGQIGLQQFIEFSLTAAAVCGIIGALFPTHRLFDESPPILGEIALCLTTVLIAACYNTIQHLFLRAKNRAVSYYQSILVVAIISAAFLPAMQLAGPVEDNAPINVFQTIVGCGLLFLIIRADKYLYEVRYRDVLVAQAKTVALSVAVVAPIAALLA